MKMTIIAEIKDDDGMEEIRPIEIDVEVPDFEEFEATHNFRELFRQLEETLSGASEKALRLAFEEYLALLSKRNSRQGTKDGED
ncbi:MAG: hypothetical protein M0Z41_00930 [Peptococcaceae bacterium]|nr:hypothetical protein [Peptococcaceae bacterium]